MPRLTLLLLFLAFGIAASIASAQSEDADAADAKFVSLHSFDGTDGSTPNGGLVQATNGDFYGTTGGGGGGGGGTVFKITPSGTLTSLTNLDLGGSPEAGLIQATNGDLYGSTEIGGLGTGTIFRITPSGVATTLHNFCAHTGCLDGSRPAFPLVQAANGDLYGITVFGGAYSAGTVFRITPGGALTTLHTFCAETGCPDGDTPLSGLVQATNGDLYGTTETGGAYGDGTVFRITPGGALTTLYSFCSQSGCADGRDPVGGLVQARDGNLYGTTVWGGIVSSPDCLFGCGTVFKITPTGTLTTVYSFCPQAGCMDGESPQSGLIQAASGNLYGTTDTGGANGGGTLFKMSLSGTLTTLYSFCSQLGCTDGEHPEGLVQGTNGIFYGTTASGGGTLQVGTVFALSTRQAPFVETRPTIGVVGEKVTILGYELTGATSVTFNGTPAAFTIEGPTAITTTVPPGATTGKVQVITPSATLLSNVSFEVAP
jgi:uncharacterized repeat protein (TIGR03803 family)